MTLLRTSCLFLFSVLSASILYAEDIAIANVMSVQKVVYQIHPETGAIRNLAIEGDTRNMNWMLETDGSQYSWIKEEYGWGLGGFSMVSGQDTIKQQWKKAARVEQTADRVNSFYTVGDIHISVSRYHDKDDLIEEYRFSNEGKQTVNLTDIRINTPFNDNYPNAALCNRARTSAHIWEGENAAYVNATHMSGKGPHLGLVLTKGSVKSYEIKERAIKKGQSNTRGVIILNPEDITLQPGENYTLTWRIFSHQGHADFFAKALAAGSVIAKSGKYVYEIGETAQIVFESRESLENPAVSVHGKTIPVTQTGNLYTASVPVNQTGDIRVELTYNGGKKTHVSCLGISSVEELMRKRADFIMAHQQLKDVNDKRYGAYMVYDNEENKIFLNDKPSVSYHDRDEGAERLGMGIFMAMYYLKTKDEKVKESVLKYASFVRNQLQDKDYNTWSTVDHKGRNRNYNYPWVAIFYFRMFQVTGNRQYLSDGYGTLQAMYRQFGYDFYAGGPVSFIIPLLRENQMEAEAENLLAHYKAAGDNYIKIGVNYPRHEVNYEHGIVNPSIETLLELYLTIGEEKYLDGAKLQLPLLEAFSGYQPSYHLNDIPIRHWDGVWFGKRETWGDVMPHHWTAWTGSVYNLYARSTGDTSYRHRAENIVRNNLCNFFEDGRASCAYIYPYKVNGEKAQFYDPYANDQDWTLAAYLTVNEEIRPYSVLPAPQQVEYTNGSFKLKDKLTIAFPAELAGEAALASQYLSGDFSISTQLQKGKKSGDITLVLETSVLPQKPEGYILDIQSKGIVIKANAPAGILYGIQTLRQLLGAAHHHVETDNYPSLLQIQTGTITDYPTFGWRAFMLDEGRHFLGKEVVLKLLDNMAQLKMNVFHWHLVDSDGWRIEIKKYPELTKTGAFRDPYQRKGWGAVGYEYGIFDRKPAGGFYTQDEIREVVAYAAARNITIVPEIEMPGHADAAIGSYPWLGIPKEGTQKTPDNLVGTYVFDVTDPKVIEFFHDVLTEVMALFPSKVIHIGGDEVNYNYWKNSPAVSQYMKEKGIKTPADLQVDFTNKMSQWITSKGRRMMGWNEITGANIHGGKNDDHVTEQRLAPGTVVQFWEGNPSLAKKAIEDGYDVVNSHNQFTYIDFTHKSISLEKAYSFTPVPEGLTEEQKKRVLGLGCQLWTEFVPDEKAVNYRVYPRIAAYAETGWTAPDKKDYKRFLKALDYFLAEWEKQGIEYGQVQTVSLDWGEKRWKDLPANPLIDPEIYGLPECVIGDPQILTPGKFDDKWHAFFHGFSHDTQWHTWFFHSVSDDGLHWTDVSHEEGEVGIQYLFCDGDRWIQYYTASTNYMEDDKEMRKKCNTVIRARTTTDFKTWSKPVTLLIPELPKELEGPSKEARNPCVIQLPNGRYRMYYSGGTVYLEDAGYPEPKYIWCAEADNPLGPFTKREEPILVPDTNLPFRNYGCGGFKVFGYRNGYVAFYNPIYIDAEGKSRSEIRLLLSDDGLQWKEADCNPIVKPDSKIPWRSAIIYQLDVVHWEKSLLMYFNAREGWRGGAERIGAVRLDLNGEAPAVKLEKPFNHK